MRFEKHKVSVQVNLMVERMIRDELIEVSLQVRSKFRMGIEQILYRYIDQFAQLEDSVQAFLVDHDLDDERYLKRVLKNLAKEEGLAIFGDALDHLNLLIQQYCWDSDDVDEIFADERQFVAVVTPFLKVIALKPKL